MQEVIKNVQAHVPFRFLLTEKKKTVIKERINPEIGFTCADLDTLQISQVSEVARQISDAGLTVTFHAPFMDLRPGAIDPRIRNVQVGLKS